MTMRMTWKRSATILALGNKSNQAAIGTGEIDANDAHLLFALEGSQKGAQSARSASRHDVEDAVVLQIAEGGGKALPFVQGVLVDAENLRALQAQTFSGLTGSKFRIDPLDGGATQLHEARESRGTNAFLMLAIDLLSPGLVLRFQGRRPGVSGRKLRPHARHSKRRVSICRRLGNPKEFRCRARRRYLPLATMRGLAQHRQQSGSRSNSKCTSTCWLLSLRKTR